MERGSDKHGPRTDDALAAELDGGVGPGGAQSEEWDDPEGPADDDPASVTRLERPGVTDDPDPTGDPTDVDPTDGGPVDLTGVAGTTGGPDRPDAADVAAHPEEAR